MMLSNHNHSSPPTQDQLDKVGDTYKKLQLLQPEKYTDFSDSTLSTLFSKITKPYCVYNTDYKRWMYYNGKHWEYDQSGVRIRQVVRKFARDFLRYALDVTNSEEDPFYKLALSLGEASTRKMIMNDAIDNNIISEEDLDNDIYLINLQNGTYDLQSMTLLPHSYKDYLTRITNAEYIPTAQSQALDKFMNTIFSNDQELIAYAYRVLGLCLSGEIAPEAFWLLLGETTRNGKSTLLSTFSYMLGGTSGYALTCDISSLAKRKYYNGSSPSSDIARLKGARFVVASEPPKDFQFDEAKIKSLTGGDRITARMLRANEVEYQPQFKIFIATNHRPAIADDSILKSNRLRIIPFKKHFSEDEQIKGLKEHLKTPDILNALLVKCLSGWSEYQANGLDEPQIVKEAVAEYKTSGQVFDLFFESTFEKCDGCLISLTEFYPLYVDFCTENDFVIVSKHEINNFMRAKGVFKASGTINGVTHRNVLANYKYKEKTTPSNKNNNTISTENKNELQNQIPESNPNSPFGCSAFDFIEQSNEAKIKSDPQPTPNEIENRSEKEPLKCPF